MCCSCPAILLLPPPGFTMNGEPNSALLKLGHFTRIVGLVDR
jgi:hypothetical protein